MSKRYVLIVSYVMDQMYYATETIPVVADSEEEIYVKLHEGRDQFQKLNEKRYQCKSDFQKKIGNVSKKELEEVVQKHIVEDREVGEQIYLYRLMINGSDCSIFLDSDDEPKIIPVDEWFEETTSP